MGISRTEIVLQGTLSAVGTLHLDEKPPLPAGRVQVIVQPLPVLPTGDPFWDLLQSIWAGQRVRGHVPRSVADVEADRRDLREGWARRQQALEQLAGGRPPPARPAVKIGLDSNCVICLVEHNPVGSPKIVARLAWATAAGDTLAVCDLARSECLIGPLRNGDGAVLADYYPGGEDCPRADLTQARSASDGARRTALSLALRACVKRSRRWLV